MDTSERRLRLEQLDQEIAAENEHCLALGKRLLDAWERSVEIKERLMANRQALQETLLAKPSILEQHLKVVPDFRVQRQHHRHILVVSQGSLTLEELELYNLWAQSEEFVIQLEENGYLTAKDLETFRANIRKAKPSVEIVKEVELWVRKAQGDNLKAEILRLRIGGSIRSLHLKVKEYFSDYEDDDGSAYSKSSVFHAVPLLALSSCASTPPVSFDFIGRSGFLELRDLVLRLVRLGRGHELFLTGSSGSGKSFIFATLAGFLYSRATYHVVYLIAPLVIADAANVAAEDPLATIRNALLLAYAEDAEMQFRIVHLCSKDAMRQWCQSLSDTLLVFIDGWNHLYSDKSISDSYARPARDAARQMLVSFFSNHILLKCSSYGSDSTRAAFCKHKERKLFMLYSSPYSAEELQCWMAMQGSSNLNIWESQFEYYTGYVPRLASYYVAARNVRELVSVYFKEYTSVISECVKSLTAADIDQFEKVLTGSVLQEDMMDCNLAPLTIVTYEEHGKMKLYSQYLANFAYKQLMARKGDLTLKKSLLHIEVWKSAIQLDLQMQLYNSARVGWNVEAIVVGVIEIVGLKVHGMDFLHIERYEIGGYLNLQRVQAEKWVKGVLFVPTLFNEACVDLVFCRKEGNGWFVAGLQISVTSWESKSAKGSDAIWSSPSMYASWVPPGHMVVQTWYVYVMRESQRQQTFKTEPRILNLRACAKVTNDAITVMWLQFTDVHEGLAFLDEDIDIKKPKPLIKT